MKGSTQGIEFIWAVVAYTFFLISLILILQAHFQKISVDVSSLEPALRGVDVAHAAKNCLTERGEIKKDLLTDRRVNSCGLGGYYIRVTDLETKDMVWQHGTYGYGQEHRVFAVLESGDKAKAGEIYVKA